MVVPRATIVRRALPWHPLAFAVTLVGACAPVRVAVDDEVDIHAVREVPVAIGGQVPVTIDRQVPVALQGEGAVRITQPVPVALTGPISVNVSLPGVQYEGTYISAELMELVKPGETTDEWVLAVFGEPTARTKLADGSEIWRWTYRAVSDTGPAFTLFGGGDKEKAKPTQTPSVAFVRIRGGTVIEKWRG